MVWQHEDLTGDYNIYAQRVGVGGLVGSQIYLTLNENDDINPAVAYNHAAQEFMVVWERRIGSGGSAQGDIIAQRMNTDGSLAGSQIIIDNETVDESKPAVSTWENSTWSGYLVAWQDKATDYDIHAHQVSNMGTLIGSELSVVTWANDQLKPSIACAEKCLLVWEDHHWSYGEYWDIYGQRYMLNTSGLLQLDGGNIGIGWDGEDYRVDPVVTFNECTGYFVVTYEYRTDTSNLGIKQRVVLSDGGVIGEEIIVSDGSQDEIHPAISPRVPCSPLLIWEDDRNNSSTGIDIYGVVLNTCNFHCDCPQEMFCYKGRCLKDEKQAVYCCEKSGCMPGQWCLTWENTKERCPEDPDWFCQTACDCGPAHCCKDNLCVKDIDDPWLPGGTEIGPPCVDRVDATYCCTRPDCTAGRTAYGPLANLDFLCYAPTSSEIKNYCGSDSCFGTACSCGPGNSCVDTIQNSPPGSACFLLVGGSCVPNALAEAVYGWSASELKACVDTANTTGTEVDFGWLTASEYAYQRVTGIFGTCGNGACDAGEYPHTCPSDCHCGDGQCAPSEVNTCNTDCGYCGDGSCQDWESPFTCPRDCKILPGDRWCDLDEVWSSPNDCTCPDAPYFPQGYTVCGDQYYMGNSPLNPERITDACEDEYADTNKTPESATSIDNQQIIFARRYGGSKGAIVEYFAPDIGRSILAKAGNVYIAGQTFTFDFPGTSSIDNLDWDAIVMKHDYDGDLIFSRYLGTGSGLGHDKYVGRDIAVNSSRNIFVAGSMGVAIITPNGSRIETYPNSTVDSVGAYGIALDAVDNIYLVGSQEYGALKLDPDGEILYHNTLLGGTAYDVALDGLNNAYIAGDFGFMKLDEDGEIQAYTNLGGIGYGVAYKSGLVYITGRTYSTAFPSTTGAFDTTYDPSGEAFVVVLDTSGNVIYGTYLGGSGFETGTSVAVDDGGSIYITGYTFSPDFPTTVLALDRDLSGIGDAFVTVINPNGNGLGDLLYSTFIGGNDPAVPPYLTPDKGYGITLDDLGMVYITGETGSPDFLTGGASSTTGFTDVFLMKLDLPLIVHTLNLPLVIR